LTTSKKIAYLFSEQQEQLSFAQMNKNAFYYNKHYETPLGKNIGSKSQGYIENDMSGGLKNYMLAMDKINKSLKKPGDKLAHERSKSKIDLNLYDLNYI
jgi:hypothetical protein